MQRLEIDSVPVRWEQGPAPLRATLTFGVGARDETFRTIGVTHLVEHLAMSALERVYYETNASVDLSTTSFTVCGRPEQVSEFLTAVCRSLGDLPVDRIAREAGVLTAEGGFYDHPTVEALLHERFGARGLGLSIYTGPGYDRLSAEQVRAHLARYFVAGNAVLQLTGPPPEGLRLPLPPGPRPARDLQTAPATAGPTWIDTPAPGAGLSMVGGRGPVWGLGANILAERLERVARHEHGLSYEIAGAAVPLAGDQVLMAFVLDAREGQEGTVAGLVWEQLTAFAANGPTAAELAHEIAQEQAMHDDPRFVELDLAQAAQALLLDRDYPERAQRFDQMLQVTPEAVRELFASAVPSAQLVVACGAPVFLDGLAEGGCPRVRVAPPGRTFKPPMLAKLLTREAWGRALILMPDGVAQRDPDGDVHVVRWADVIGVEHYQGERLVFGAGGCQVAVDPELFAGAEAAVAAVDAAVPAPLCFSRSGLIPPD